jgi:hypothetical protein
MDFNCVQRYQSIVNAASVGCDPMASPSIERRPGSPSREQQPRTSHLRADAGTYIVE